MLLYSFLISFLLSWLASLLVRSPCQPISSYIHYRYLSVHQCIHPSMRSIFLSLANQHLYKQSTGIKGMQRLQCIGHVRYLVNSSSFQSPAHLLLLSHSHSIAFIFIFTFLTIVFHSYLAPVNSIRPLLLAVFLLCSVVQILFQFLLGRFLFLFFAFDSITVLFCRVYRSAIVFILLTIISFIFVLSSLFFSARFYVR